MNTFRGIAMRDRQLLLVIDRRPPWDRVLDLAADIAVPLSLRSIRCLISDWSAWRRGVACQPTVGLQEFGFAVVSGGSLFPGREQPRREGSLRRVVERMCLRRAHQHGLRFAGTAFCGTEPDAVVDEGSRCGLVCFGRSSIVGDGWLNPVARTLIRRGLAPILVCPRSYTTLNRIVVAAPRDPRAVTLALWGANWARLLHLPLTILSVAPTAKKLTQHERFVRQALEVLEIDAEVAGLTSGLAGMPNALSPTDLLLIGSYGRHWAVRACLGSHTEFLVGSSPCPVCVLPAGAPGGAEKLVVSDTLRDNCARDAWSFSAVS